MQKVTIFVLITSSLHDENSIYIVFNTVKKFIERK